ncbi:unnamed protein product [Lactuca virosa]|uniref:Uncharacterized protein n=1 Tax=Lactuca virosa TaxID=75947 RepID=A0AAU9NLT5_9ASTR|nr:unnamed protein product [Lactuca virosa]
MCHIALTDIIYHQNDAMDFKLIHTDQGIKHILSLWNFSFSFNKVPKVGTMLLKLCYLQAGFWNSRTSHLHKEPSIHHYLHRFTVPLPPVYAINTDSFDINQIRLRLRLPQYPSFEDAISSTLVCMCHAPFQHFTERGTVVWSIPYSLFHSCSVSRWLILLKLREELGGLGVLMVCILASFKSFFLVIDKGSTN